jgi:hypothetical protein
MSDWISDNKTLFWWLAVASVVTFIGTLIVVPFLVVRIPEDYFLDRRPHRLAWWERHPALRIATVIVKNVVGVIFIIAGIAMLVLPGQGIITIFVGLVLCDFPGKYRLKRWLASQRPLIKALNWIRKRAGRPPLTVPTRRRPRRERSPAAH